MIKKINYNDYLSQLIDPQRLSYIWVCKLSHLLPLHEKDICFIYVSINDLFILFCPPPLKIIIIIIRDLIIPISDFRLKKFIIQFHIILKKYFLQMFYYVNITTSNKKYFFKKKIFFIKNFRKKINFHIFC